ncbi:MAG: hypothetical protein Q7S83_02830 [bacterium]|nr:hypothetical protein [bacterium]
MIFLMVILVWGLFGFLAYGLDKGKYRDQLRRAEMKASNYGQAGRDEIRHWIVGLMGPIWLAALMISLVELCFLQKDLRFWKYLFFCLKLPKELK